MIVHAFERVEDWVRTRARSGRLLVALDFDGTLAPIADRPGDAVALPEAADAVRRLAARGDTLVAVVSGRGLEDVRRRVGIDGLYYAGNHGMEIDGPGLERTAAEARAARPALDACVDSLAAALRGIRGTELEDKGLTLSLHYRRVAADQQPDVRRRVVEACGGRAGLRISEGKKVVEIRPDIDWTKGDAVSFILDSLAGSPTPPALYAGDDETDEDAFRTLRGRGDGILVEPEPRPTTAATAFVRSPEEIAELLSRLAV